MSDNETQRPSDDERIRKTYVKDLKSGEAVRTVFKATRKERASSRAGKPYLSLTLTDRTGQVDGRVFENVEAADGAFAAGDYLLLDGRVGAFHGKTQIVVDRLERLDPEPIDPAEFEFVAPVSQAPKEREKRAEKPERPDDDAPSHKAARQRLLKLLDHPPIALGLDALLTHLEKQIEERVVARLSGQPLPAPGAGPRVEKKARPPRPERAEAHRAAEGDKPEVARRDGALPEGLAFKPFKALIGDGESPTGGA
ncbi:MAG: hypothetical protein INH41_31845 [Myxococcaceae bacterium]|nr:hypothetical protein [Myxococcaceae bacterium]MCA3017000.1 hypothetical protein [Myxococcaceae bacterium]